MSGGPLGPSPLGSDGPLGPSSLGSVGLLDPSHREHSHSDRGRALVLNGSEKFFVAFERLLEDVKCIGCHANMPFYPSVLETEKRYFVQ